jgi:hypothetical protein
MLDKSKRKLWEDLNEKYKEYMMNADEIWNNIYEELVCYFESKKKDRARHQKINQNLSWRYGWENKNKIICKIYIL